MALTQVPSTMMQVGGVPSFDGIKFPASQVTSADANTLDDYEEGTWTAVDASGAGLTFTNNTGYYTKVGNLVTWWIDLNYPTTASGANSAIGGFPFAQASTGNGGAVGGGCVSYTSTGLTLSLYGQNGATTMIPYQSNGGRVANSTLSAKELALFGSFRTNT